jgi:hypothetical protein
MYDSKIETATYSATTVERRSSPIAIDSLNNDEVFYATQNSGQCEMNSPREDYYSALAMDVNHLESSQQSSSFNTVDQLVNQQYRTDINQYQLNEDPNPEHIRRQNNDRVTYRQDVAIRYLQPPTPPPPGPVIVREIRAPQLPQAPPLVIRQRPPVPSTPPPIVIRERPPVPPCVEPSRVVNKYLPAPPPLPRQLIIERQAPLPQKPQPVIIEKWLPYKAPPERRVVVERAQPLAPVVAQRNRVITFDAPHVDLVKNVRNLGTVRVDPHMYAVQYGSQLTSSEYVLNTMSRFGIGSNYAQMIQMQTQPQSSMYNNHQMQMIDSHQSINYGESHRSSAYRSQNGDHCDYIEKHIDETILPDGRRKQHSSITGSNEQEVLRQATMIN